jgi:hypothetical protein
MLRSTLLLFALGLGTSAYAQEDTPEYHPVTGSRIWPPAGPVWAAEGPNTPAPGHGCADPTCGGTIDPKEPGSGGGVLTESQKQKENKTAKEKAKALAQTIWTSAKGAADFLKAVRAWLGGISFEKTDVEFETVDGNGVKSVKRCKDMRITALGPADKDALPCTEIMGNPEQVQRSNGTIENQLRLTFAVHDICYYEKKCGVKYISVVAGSEQELSRLMNEMTGTTDF